MSVMANSGISTQLDNETSRSGTGNGEVRSSLILHVVHRLSIGGMENGLVNLINRMPRDRYRHAVLSLTDFTDFRRRIQPTDVPVLSLNKRNGQDVAAYGRLRQVLRSLRPNIVHTRNLGTLEYLVPSALFGIHCRIHGEHGRDVYDPDGLTFKYNLLRRSIRPFVHRYIAVSGELADWLVNIVGVRPDRVQRICNGVDVTRFRPRTERRGDLGPQGFASSSQTIIGTVGRMEAIKDQLTLVRAFLHLITDDPDARARLRLAMIGDGALRQEAQKIVCAAGAESLVWFAGERNDIPELMRGLDLFILPSLREGISNTILEAMASGLPVIATNVGGNPELVVNGETGMLVSPSDPVAMAEAIHSYLKDPVKLKRHGQAGRKRAEEQFSIEKMVEGYLRVYDEVLAERGGGRGAGGRWQRAVGGERQEESRRQ
jgi:sugar transferase (PEP-CTERM/EpsH1 system associated)